VIQNNTQRQSFPYLIAQQNKWWYLQQTQILFLSDFLFSI